MAAEFTAEEIMDLTGARLAAGMMRDEAGRIVIDTRCDLDGAWFLALPGRKYDGHDFIGDAFNNGALGCIVVDRPAYAIASTSFPLLAVGDCSEALATLTRNWRRRTLKKLCLVFASGSDDNLFDQVCLYLDGLAAAAQAEDGKRLLRWRIDKAEIMAEFLGLDDSADFLIADFAPPSLACVPELLACLAPNVVVMSEQAFDYDRLSCDEGAYRQIKSSIASALSNQKKPPCLTIKTDQAAILPENPEGLYQTWQSAGLAGQMGLK